MNKKQLIRKAKISLKKAVSGTKEAALEIVTAFIFVAFTMLMADAAVRLHKEGVLALTFVVIIALTFRMLPQASALNKIRNKIKNLLK